MGVVVTEGDVVGARGLRIHHQAWLPDTAPIGVVVIVHGFAEHSGRYAYLAERLTGAGYAVRAGDHRGHGRSEGKRTSIVRFGDYLDDLDLIVRASSDEWPGLPLTMLGHSLGGLIALAYAARDQEHLDGLVVSAPAACPGGVSRLRTRAGMIISLIAPEVGVLRVPLNRISSDPAVVAAYNSDPLVFRTPIRARLGAEMLGAMDRVDDALPAFRVPLLVMQGTDDGIVDPRCGPQVYERAGSADKTLKLYDGFWHEIFNEPGKEQPIGDLLAWLAAHRG